MPATREGPVSFFRHVTVGKNFASYVVHQKRRFVYFTIGKLSFLVYKAQ